MACPAHPPIEKDGALFEQQVDLVADVVAPEVQRLPVAMARSPLDRFVDHRGFEQGATGVVRRHCFFAADAQVAVVGRNPAHDKAGLEHVHPGRGGGLRDAAVVRHGVQIEQLPGARSRHAHESLEVAEILHSGQRTHVALEVALHVLRMKARHPVRLGR